MIFQKETIFLPLTKLWKGLSQSGKTRKLYKFGKNRKIWKKITKILEKNCWNPSTKYSLAPNSFFSNHPLLKCKLQMIITLVWSDILGQDLCQNTLLAGWQVLGKLFKTMKSLGMAPNLEKSGNFAAESWNSFFQRNFWLFSTASTCSIDGNWNFCPEVPPLLFILFFSISRDVFCDRHFYEKSCQKIHWNVMEKLRYHTSKNLRK